MTSDRACQLAIFCSRVSSIGKKVLLFQSPRQALRYLKKVKHTLVCSFWITAWRSNSIPKYSDDTTILGIINEGNAYREQVNTTSSLRRGQ